MLNQFEPLVSKRCLAALAVSLLLASAAAIAEPAPAQEQQQTLQLAGDGPWLVRIPYESREQVRALSQWADLWAVYPQKGYLVILVDRLEAEQLLAQGFQPRVDEQRTQRLRMAGKALASQTSGIPGFPCYRTVEETFAAAQQIVADYPDLASWIDAGDSWSKSVNPANGYDIMVLRLTQSAIPGPKPTLFTNYSIHAREYTTAELGTRFAEMLVQNYDKDPDITWLLDYNEIHLMLVTNPDGRKKAETGLSWRKNTNSNYCSVFPNSIGADLNRNFEFEWGCCGGSSGSQCSTTYRGPSPASEPETQAMQNYVMSIFPDQRDPDLSSPAPDDATGVAIDIHSHGQLVLWPWGFTSTPAPNSAQLTTLGRKMAYFNGHTPQAGIELYPTDGTTDAFIYGELGVAAFAFELGTEFFESCNYFEFNILQQNLESLLQAAKAARAPYLEPSGPDTIAPSVAPQAYAPGESALLTAAIDDTRYSSLNGTEPTQAIAAAEAYLDVPPWQAGATPQAMSASDGQFDSSIEAVQSAIDTTGLSPGRYTLFVRGLDAAGNWGMVSAAFLHVIDPLSAPVLQGTLRDADTAAPLAGATVTAGDFEAVTDPAGFYSMQLPAGVYDVTAAAAGYQSATVEGVSAADFQTIVRDFNLLPFSGALADDAESGNIGWTAQSPWAITSEASYSPSHSWTDSPGSLYANNLNSSLTSPSLDLSSLTGVSLTFRHLYELEAGFDFGHVEFSTDGGQNWTEAAVYSGSSDGVWKAVEIALPMLDQAADGRIRFRIETDESLQEDGWHLDDILVRGVSEPQCSGNEECDDGLYCNGVEVCASGTCQPGTPVACDDGVSCTVDSCDEASDSCQFTPDDGLCDNGLYCDGAETCDAALDCRPGTPVSCDDGVDCTNDSCNETTDSCQFTPDDAFCSNGLFCDGAETCDPALGCLPASPVNCDDGVACTIDSCNEAADSCDNTPDDAFCDNGLFCDGAETCDPALGCQAGSDPCPGELCDEDADSCAQCFVDADCDDGLFCNGAETCLGGACQAGTDPCPGQSCDEASDTCFTAPAAQLEWGSLTVGSTPVTVTLSNSYASPVVVAALQYSNNSVPVVTRISNLTAGSFDIRLQNPSNGTAAAENVSYLVVEEGSWTIDGVQIEAHAYASTVTDENNSWVGEAQSYAQSYTSPVVLGQVMSENDPDWSVFWAQGSKRNSPPSATDLRTGKTVCEDSDATRADETVGFIVFEAGHGSIGGVEFEAWLGDDSVQGVTNSPPYTYAFQTPFASAPTVAVVNMAGMDDRNGGWAIVYGPTPATATSLFLAIDEDQIGDSERNHNSEQVGYVVFAAPGAYP